MVKGLSGFCLTTVLLALLLTSSVRGQRLPLLQITNTNGTDTISWPTSDFSGFILQTTTNMSSLNAWSDMSTPTNVISGRTSTNLLTTGRQQFFRLRLPLFSYGLGTPIFQFAIFYNSDLEISPDQSMIVNGNVFCNGNIWASPDGTLTFQSNVWCSGTFQKMRGPNDPLPNGAGMLIFDAPFSPIAYASPFVAMTGYFTPVNGTILPISNQANVVGAMFDPPPTGEDPNSPAGRERFYNFADMIITNSSNGLITAYFQDTNNSVRLTPIPYDSQAILEGMETNYSTDYQTNVIFVSHPPPGHYVTNIDTITTTNIVEAEITNDVYSFATNTTFYDYREGKTVQAVQIDVGNLAAWFTNNAVGGGSSYNTENLSDKGHGIDSVYVYSDVPLSATTLPAIRLIDGRQLPPSGLTIATPMPLYVLGDYNVQTPDGTSVGTNNTVYTYPAAFMADAVTILSSNWNDGYDGTTDLAQRPAANTTVNAAMLQGIVSSVTVDGVKHYSGGAENFLRLLEDWSNSILTYNGSMVAMFNCRYATNYWQSPGSYYNVPTWQWRFDANFLNQNRLPPGTPNVISNP